MERYIAWARRQHSPNRRVLVLLLLAPVFLGLLPLLVAGGGPRLDRRLALPPLGTGRSGRVVGMLLAAGGFSIAMWTIDAQLERGRGTPLPVMPTQELLTGGPFRLCRNPMTLGTILAYGGIALAARSPSGLGIVAALSGGLLAYVRGIEERELAARFGEPYLAYRRSTPFLLPRPWTRR